MTRSNSATRAETEPETAATRLRLPEAQRQGLVRHALASYPFEACGLLVGRRRGPTIETLHAAPARNLDHERPCDRFLLHPEDFVAADMAARAEGLDVVGIWHSHPDHPPEPSRTDLEAAWQGYSYLIVGVTARGEVELRSWRFDGRRFLEEEIQLEVPQA